MNLEFGTASALKPTARCELLPSLPALACLRSLRSIVDNISYAQQEEIERALGSFDILEKKEGLAAKMDKIQSVTVKGWRCDQVRPTNPLKAFSGFWISEV